MQETVVAAPTAGGAAVGSERATAHPLHQLGRVRSGSRAEYLQRFYFPSAASRAPRASSRSSYGSSPSRWASSNHSRTPKWRGCLQTSPGGASVYGATAWIEYSKFVAPLSVWCNWFAWSPVLSLGCAIAAAYLLNAFAPIPSVDCSVVKGVDERTFGNCDRCAAYHRVVGGERWQNSCRRSAGVCCRQMP